MVVPPSPITLCAEEIGQGRELQERPAPIDRLRYQGYFHTDHLIPSVFFQKGQPTHLFEDLGLAYMHDQREDDYEELMGGELTNAYTVRSEVWLSDGKDLAKDFTFEKAERDEAHRWLESRLWARCR